MAIDFSEIAILFLASYSLTFGWIESSLFASIKKLKFFDHHIRNYLTFCYHCCGFWISFIVLLLYYRTILQAIILALSYSIVMLWFNTLLVFLQSYIKKN